MFGFIVNVYAPPDARLAVEVRLRLGDGLPEQRVLLRWNPGHLELRRVEVPDAADRDVGPVQLVAHAFHRRDGLEPERVVGVDPQHEVDATPEVEAQPDLLRRRDDCPQAGADDDNDEECSPADVFAHGY